MKTAKVHITGVVPCLMHNGQMANPRNPFAKAMKAISSKKAKTDDDHEAMALIELEAGYYIDENDRPCWPGDNIESMFIAGAKKLKLGQLCKAAVWSDGLWPIEYKGPKTYQELMQDDRFVDTRGVKIQTSTVMRTRPIFKDWGLSFDITFNPELVNESQIRQILDICGEQIGLSDFRPKYGRFLVDSCEIGSLKKFTTIRGSNN